MPEDTIEVSVRMADRGEVGYRMVSASISSREGSLAGAPVAFTIEDGPGTLASAGGRQRTVDSDEWGIAEVNWYPEQHARSSPESRSRANGHHQSRLRDRRRRLPQRRLPPSGNTKSNNLPL